MPYTPFVRETWTGWWILIAGTLVVSASSLWRWQVFKRVPKTEFFKWEATGHLIRCAVFLFLVWFPAILMIDSGVGRHNHALLQKQFLLTKDRAEVHAILRSYSATLRERYQERNEYWRIKLSFFQPDTDVLHITYRSDGTVEYFHMVS